MSYKDCIAVAAGADFRADGQYKALVIAGTIAANGETAIGILQNKPNSGEDASLAFNGRIKYRAGAAVSAGAQVSVTTSGWVITATSGEAVVGRALEAVSSGGIGEGIFNFASNGTLA